MSNDLKQLAETLHEKGCSCVIENEEGLLTIGHERGVRDLMNFLKNSPEVLRGALMADKVVGKGAAALMILGGVKGIYADVISVKAYELLDKSGVDVQYGVIVENIINREGTGNCPVETLCSDCATAEECLPLIEAFLSRRTVF